MSSTRTARARAQASNLTNLAHANTHAHAHTNRPYLGRVWERSGELKAGLWSVGEMPRGKKRGGAERRERCCFPDGKLRLPALSLFLSFTCSLSLQALFTTFALLFFLHHPSHQCLHLCAPFAVADFLHLIHDHRGWDADLRRNADNNDHQGPFFQKSFHRSKCVW